MKVPQLVGHPAIGEQNPVIGASLEFWTDEFLDYAPILHDSRPQRILRFAFKVRHRNVETDFLTPNRCIHFYVRDARSGRGCSKENIAAKSATVHLALHLTGSIGIGVGEKHGFERHGYHQQAQNMGVARAKMRGQIAVAAWKANLAAFISIDEHDGVGVQILDCQVDAPPGPILRQ